MGNGEARRVTEAQPPDAVVVTQRVGTGEQSRPVIAIAPSTKLNW